MLIHLENEDFKEVISGGVVLVDFYAEWCGPCKMLGPVLEDIANTSDYKIVKVDVDKHNDLAREYGIMSVPTMMIMKDGVVQKSMVGFLPKDIILNELGNIK